MYLKKALKNLMAEFDNEVKLPSKFYQYLEDIKKSHKLVIKSKDGYFCENCDKRFTKQKVYEKYGAKFVKCPYCKKWLITKTNRKKHFSQTDNFCIIENFKGYIIFRLFSVRTFYTFPHCYDTDYCEYGRQIYKYTNTLELIEEVYNENVNSTLNGRYITYQYFMNSNWKAIYNRYYGFGDEFKLYPYNLKKVFKNTKWQYCQIWNFAKHIDIFGYFGYFNINGYLSIDVELLVKNKLYIMANSLINNYFIIKIDNKFLYKNIKFVKKHHLDIDEYLFFEKFKIENIRLIRNYAQYLNNFTKTFFDLKIDLEKADREILNIKNNLIDYLDYLEICKSLEYNMKDKRILYPHKDIVEEHDRVNDLFIVYQNKKINKSIKNRYLQIKNNIYKNKKYIIFPVKSQSQLINESSQQNNCVKTYAERIANGVCDIYFMRLLSEPKKSLVTVEVRNNKVVQQRTKFNEATTKEQQKFLELWERKILNMKG